MTPGIEDPGLQQAQDLGRDLTEGNAISPKQKEKATAGSWANDIDKTCNDSSEQPKQALPAMNRYKCHKEVYAFKINAISYDVDRAGIDNRETDGSGYLLAETPFGTELKVSANYLTKHNPQVGGYYVRYDDGYESYSPAKAFEEGYTLTTKSLAK